MADVLSARPGETAPEFKRPRPYYELWQGREGIPAHDMFHVEDLTTVALAFWERLGCDAAFINLADSHVSSAIVLELKPGQRTRPIKHMFETWIFIAQGRGETIIRQEGAQDARIPWQPRTLFGPPLNTTYQHFNRDADKPARILMVTNAPLTMNLYHSDKFVFDNAFVFDDRYAGEQGYFNPTYEVLAPRYVRTNMVKDVRESDLHDWKARGQNARSIFLCMSHHTIGAHVSEFAPGTYKKAHRHGPGAHVIILQGQGYSLNWKEGDKPTRVDWRENSMFSPPDLWYHQHFNTGSEPARYLALKSKGAPDHPIRLGTPGPNADPDSIKLHQIEHEYEEPWIYDMFVEELKKNGVPLRQERPNYRK